MIFADRERSRDCWSNKGLSLGRCKELVSPGCCRKILLGSASEDLSARQFIEAEGQKVGKRKSQGPLSIAQSRATIPRKILHSSTQSQAVVESNDTGQTANCLEATSS